MITSDFLISRFNITFNHKTLYQSVKLRIYLTAVENLFCNTNLLVILFVGIGVVGINDNSRILQVLFLIFFPEETKIFVMIVWNCFPVFIYSTAENCVSQFVACGFYFPASVDKPMSTLSRYNGIEHNCKVATGRVFHTCGNVHTTDSKTVLLVFHRTCTYCHIRKQVGKITVIFRIKHLICTGHTTGLDCMDVHFSDCDKSSKKVWLFLGIRLVDHTFIAFSCCSWFVCVNTWNNQNLVSYFFLNIA